MSARSLLRRTGEQAGRFARMTREDSEQLTAVFVQVGRRHARDTLAGMRLRLREKAERARRAAGLGDRPR